ncbi:MAG: phage tail terminator-like protein [Telluria sp.]
MSIAKVRMAMEKRLATMSPALATAYENVTFSPVVGTPYQRINMLQAAPADLVKGRTLTELSGLMQVTLFYPQGTGPAAAEARAELIKAHFKPPMTLTEGAVNVHVNNTARVATGFPDGDRYAVPVSIPWIAYITN